MKNLTGLMKQAQEIQARMGEMQERVAALEVEGTSGAGLVTVTLRGKGELKGVKVDPSLMVADEVEILEDLLVAAHADAKARLDDKLQEEMKSVTGGMPLPPGFSL
ncbi:YbaB/EbfC family nucleoid-associated protein [Pyruvatibacter sp.]|uniref:YbaB/EbfC family nucleoid-associated protein n=1 Tax=unclassified Pyruvatibacter TaxID=2618840 RepID=UPI00296A5182|nr:YbaB/EbfC family nucleoid-associated protein [Alphaproteobacteria bacterium]